MMIESPAKPSGLPASAFSGADMHSHANATALLSAPAIAELGVAKESQNTDNVVEAGVSEESPKSDHNAELSVERVSKPGRYPSTGALTERGK